MISDRRLRWRTGRSRGISDLKFQIMATLKNFEEIEVWQKSRMLANRIFQLIQQEPFSKDYKLKEQINGSSGSIMDNIAEGFERDGKREFIQFLSIAKGSAGETRSQLYRAFDRKYITKETFEVLTQESKEISKQLAGLIRYLNNTDIKGIKYMNEPDEPYHKSDYQSEI